MSLSYTPHAALRGPCWELTTHAYPTLALRERHQTIDVVEFHVERQKSSYSLIIDTEKESKSLEKRDNGKVCPVTARHPLPTQLHTRSGLLV